MNRSRFSNPVVLVAAAVVMISGCRNHMPHAFTWPGRGRVARSHPKPPEGGYYKNWDPYAVRLDVTPDRDVNPVQTQHVLVATVLDENGEPLPNRRVEWIVSSGSVGDIIEVDESGWRASRGYKVNNHYAVSHTNNFDHILDRGNDDPSDDIELEAGQTWCVVSSPIEGDTHITVYAPGIYNWERHKVFVTKHWYDVAWEFPPAAVNPIGTDHELTTIVHKHSDGAPLAGYVVNYTIEDGPAAVFEPGGKPTASVETNANGLAVVTLKQVKPVEGENTISVDIIRPEDLQCCKPAAHIVSGVATKRWIGPKIAISKDAPATALVGERFEYSIVVTNPSEMAASNVVVSDELPEGIDHVSSSPAAKVSGRQLGWSLGALAPKGKKSITVVVAGSRKGRFENCAAVSAAHDLSGHDCATTVIVSPDLKLEKRCTPEATPCDPIEYTIVVRNTGDGPARNIEVRDTLPEGVVTKDGRRNVVGRIELLKAGEAREFKYAAQASKPGTYKNVATAKADGGLSAEASCTTVVRQPKLEVTKTAPELRFVGRSIDYEIVVANTGDTTATDAVLVDEVPAGTEFVRASDGGRVANGTVTWRLGTMRPGQSKKVTLTVKAVRRGAMRNVATATAECAEASAAVVTQVKGIPAILLEVIDRDDPIELGANETYIITVTNQGSADGTNIVVECTLPAEGQYVTSNGPTRAAVQGQVVRFAPLPSLAPKAKATYQVVVKAVGEGDVRFKVVLTSDQITRPVEETESTNFYE